MLLCTSVSLENSALVFSVPQRFDRRKSILGPLCKYCQQFECSGADNTVVIDVPSRSFLAMLRLYNAQVICAQVSVLRSQTESKLDAGGKDRIR